MVEVNLFNVVGSMHGELVVLRTRQRPKLGG